MKQTSLTHRHVRSRCPKRYFYRYLYRHSQASVEEKLNIERLSCLFGFREMLGYLVHEALTQLINRIVAEGYSPSSADDSERWMMEELNQSVLASQCGLLSDQHHGIAEIVNGVDITDELKDAEDLLRHYFQTGIQLIHMLGIKQGDEVWTELSDQLRTEDATYHLRIDLILKRGKQIWVIDWKTKSDITRQDRNQVALYLEWARRHFRVAPTQLCGMIASLHSGQFTKVPFDIFHPVSLTSAPSLEAAKSLAVLLQSTTSKPPTVLPAAPKTSYAANPDPVCCRACPYASVCLDSTLSSKEEVAR